MPYLKNVASKSNQQKNFSEKIVFCWHLRSMKKIAGSGSTPKCHGSATLLCLQDMLRILHNSINIMICSTIKLLSFILIPYISINSCQQKPLSFLWDIPIDVKNGTKNRKRVFIFEQWRLLKDSSREVALSQGWPATMVYLWFIGESPLINKMAKLEFLLIAGENGKAKICRYIFWE